MNKIVYYKAKIGVILGSLYKLKTIWGLSTFSSVIINRFFNPDQDAQIWVSFPNQMRRLVPEGDYTDSMAIQLSSLSSMPVVVRSQDLFDKDILPNWAFGSLLIQNPIKVCKSADSPSCRLSIDLTGNVNGIYNTGGKLFLKLWYLGKGQRSMIQQASKELDTFIESSEVGERSFDIGVPIRWASGGALPIVHYRGREWFVLFRRDVSPIGLNIANGSSEREEELTDIYRLMHRELLEELALLNQNPLTAPGTPIIQKKLRFEGTATLNNPSECQRVTEDHRELRKSHDGITIGLSDQGPTFCQVDTPFEIEILHDGAGKGVRSDVVENVLFFVNPLEFGMEAVIVGRIQMEDGDYILDGETWNNELLVRQPVMLLSCDFVKGEYAAKKKIGIPISNDKCEDCRVFEEIPPGEYILFTADIELRKLRLRYLVETGKEHSTEATRIRRWLDSYGDVYSRIDQSTTALKPTEHPDVATLCPVTWKAFETLCKFELI